MMTCQTDDVPSAHGVEDAREGEREGERERERGRERKQAQLEGARSQMVTVY